VNLTSYENRITENNCLFVVLMAEIENLRSRVKDKEREVEEIRRSSLLPYRHWWIEWLHN